MNGSAPAAGAAQSIQAKAERVNPMLVSRSGGVVKWSSQERKSFLIGSLHALLHAAK